MSNEKLTGHIGHTLNNVLVIGHALNALLAIAALVIWLEGSRRPQGGIAFGLVLVSYAFAWLSEGMAREAGELGAEPRHGATVEARRVALLRGSRILAMACVATSTLTGAIVILTMIR